MTNEYATEHKGYSTFQDIENRMLRAFNQWNVLSNMQANKLGKLGLEYLDKLSQSDRIGLYVITEYIRSKGLEETKRELIIG